MIVRFLNSKTKTVTFAAIVLGVSALLSRFLGLLRDNLLANLLPKSQTDIYFAAFRIPDFVYGILITGGIVAAFLPVFSEQIKKSKERAQELTNNVLTFFLIGLILISVILAILAPFLVELIVPGFTPEQKALTKVLTRIMFLSPILLGLSAIFSGILHYFNLFFAVALAPIFYNVGIIFGILFFRPFFGLAGLAWGVIMGAGFHLIVQIPPALKVGFFPRFSFKPNYPGLKKIFKLMLPRTLGSAAHHINLIVITAIASTMAVGSIRIFNFANNLQGVAVGLVGIPFAIAVFPILSKHFANQEKEKFFKNFSAIFSQIIFLIIPLSFLTFLLRAQIVRIVLGTSILGGGFFDWWDTRLTAASLGIFSVALFAAALVPFLARAFFSLQDTKTPVKIAVFSMALNIFLSFSFVKLLAFPNIFQAQVVNFLRLEGIKDISVVGLPLAFSITVLFQFFLLNFYLKRKIVGLNFKEISRTSFKVFTASILMAIFTYLTLQAVSLSLDTHKALGVLLQGGLAGVVGIFCYVFFSLLLRLKEPKIIWSSIKAQFKK